MNNFDIGIYYALWYDGTSSMLSRWRYIYPRHVDKCAAHVSGDAAKSQPPLWTDWDMLRYLPKYPDGYPYIILYDMMGHLRYYDVEPTRVKWINAGRVSVATGNSRFQLIKTSSSTCQLIMLVINFVAIKLQHLQYKNCVLLEGTTIYFSRALLPSLVIVCFMISSSI